MGRKRRTLEAACAMGRKRRRRLGREGVEPGCCTGSNAGVGQEGRRANGARREGGGRQQAVWHGPVPPALLSSPVVCNPAT
eukprot:2462476-Rhodomonas_salina.2